ncbi:MAG: ChaN family lipoprotein, partial [Bdellovibrionales bacterium]
MRKWSHFSLILVSFSFLACASAQIYHEGKHISSKDELFQSLKGSQVILLGENHGFRTHRDQHMEILRELRAQGRAVHVALEFFYYPDQARVEAYRLGQISEATFLNEIKWGQPSYDYYREQALFPNLTAGEKTWAINAPRVLTSQVARGGLGSLSSDLQQLLPPEFSLGRDSYRERFQQAMGGHVNPEAIDRYFAAQSIWDDTMAWRLSQIQQMYPQAVI